MISLAGRDILHGWSKFVLTGLGLGLLIGVTLSMAGIYRGMSRANPSDMSYSRTFQTDESVVPTTLSDLFVGVNGSGNPNAKPLMSWNYDVALEWYPNEDSIFALSLYYKQFRILYILVDIYTLVDIC